MTRRAPDATRVTTMVRRRGGPTVRFNRLRAPGEGAARDRIESVYAAVDGLSADELNSAPVPQLDLEERETRLATLERFADAAGRGELLENARDTLQRAMLARFADRLAYPYGTRAIGMARVEDQAAIVTSLRDLVAVAVMRDRLDPVDAAALAAPGLLIIGARDFDELDAMTAVREGDEADGETFDSTGEDGPDGDGDAILGGGGTDTRIAGAGNAERDAVPETLVPHLDRRPGAPSAEDWTAAERGDTALGGPDGPRVPTNRVTIVFGGLALVGLVAVLGMRVRRDDVVLGVTIALALIAVVFVVLRLRGRRC